MSLKWGFNTFRLPLEGPRVPGQLPHHPHPLGAREVRHVPAIGFRAAGHPHPNVLAVVHGVNSTPPPPDRSSDGAIPGPWGDKRVVAGEAMASTAHAGRINRRSHSSTSWILSGFSSVAR